MKRIKKMKEKDIRLVLLFCMLTALAADILCVLFLLGILQSHWILNVISALAILLHIALTLFGFVQKRTVVVWVSLLLLVGYTGNFLYYNLEWLKSLISLSKDVGAKRIANIRLTYMPERKDGRDESKYSVRSV